MADKVLVTGASGFVGTELCSQLRAQGFSVIALSSSSGDISDPSTFASYFSEPITHVFHLAGNTFIPLSWEKPKEFIRTNVLGTSVVLDFCKMKNCSLTYVSAYVYGADVVNPISEHTVPHPNNPYALSKKMAEDLCIFYAEYMQMNVNIVRPFNVYGPGQTEPFLIPFIVKQVLGSDQVKVKDLSPKRDYIHVKDLAACIIKAMHYKKFGIFNAGGGRSYSVKEVVEVVMKIGKKQLPVVSEATSRINEISDTVADIENAKKMLKWTPSIDLETGIATLF